MLRESELHPDPIEQFRLWYAEAAALPESDATALASATADGRPSVRMVLLRGFDARGFVFYTNYRSRKALEIESNPRAALLFYWAPQHRQVRIEGRVARVERSESDAYFASRARDSQLGAIASPQSQVIPDRSWLDRRFEERVARHADAAVPRPEHWGGYRLAPDAIEFWQSGLHRLHDRIRYTRWDSSWVLERLAP